MTILVSAAIAGYESIDRLFNPKVVDHLEAGVSLGYPLADPIVGLLITVAILRIVWDAAKSILPRLLDGVDPKLIEEIKHAIKHADGVSQVTDLRARWPGHRLHAEVNLSVSSERSVAEARSIAMEARHQLLHHLTYLSNATIHVDPEDASGEEHHRIGEHAHADLPAHSHP